MVIKMKAVPFWLVFVVMWVSYAATYMLRKPVGVIKSAYAQAYLLTNVQLGMLDLALLLPYAMFQMIFGFLADRFGPRKTVSLCMFGAGLSLLPFAWINGFYSFLTMLFFSGAFQSFCWCASNAGIGSWVNSAEHRQHILGYFGSSPFFGGILGTVIAVGLMKRYGWQMIYLWPSAICMIFAVLIMILYRYPPSRPSSLDGVNVVLASASKPLRGLGIIGVNGAISCALAVVCLKIVRYGMYFWLPLYFERSLNYSTSSSAYLSTIFDVGAAVGSLASGPLLKLAFNQNAVLGSTVESGLAAVSLMLFVLGTRYTIGVLRVVISAITVAVTGAMNGTPDVLLCGVIPLELVPANSVNALIGFINGLGSLGGAVEGPLFGLIADKHGWFGVLIAMVIFSLFAMLCCMHATYAIKKNNILGKSGSSIDLHREPSNDEENKVKNMQMLCA